MLITLLISWLCSHCQMNVKHGCQMAQTWWLRKWNLGSDGILHPLTKANSRKLRESKKKEFSPQKGECVRERERGGGLWHCLIKREVRKCGENDDIPKHYSSFNF